MAELRQPTSSVVGSYVPSYWPVPSHKVTRGRALATGVGVGVLAGCFWGILSPSPVVRSEALSALPAVATALGAGLEQWTAASTARPGVASVPRSLESEALHIGDAPRTAQFHPGQDATAREPEPCGERMRLVEGDYCTTLVHRCIEPYTDGSGRCSRYAEGSRCYPPVLTMRYCIDEFEYPNRRGEKPQVMVSFAEATSSCESEHKRLCTAREWTLACEGPDRMPYPHGRSRDRGACNIDLPHRFPDVEALNDPIRVNRELERLDQRMPSGSMPGCVSQFGVFDMVGNVDEWVVPDGAEEAAGLGAQTALKGGYFGPVRARCRPATPTHSRTFKFYQVGFRCCRDLVADRRLE
jgi:formylglycine-generating enzyme